VARLDAIVYACQDDYLPTYPHTDEKDIENRASCTCFRLPKGCVEVFVIEHLAEDKV
jgi:hypothetical protein